MARVRARPTAAALRGAATLLLLLLQVLPWASAARFKAAGAPCASQNGVKQAKAATERSFSGVLYGKARAATGGGGRNAPALPVRHAPHACPPAALSKSPRMHAHLVQEWGASDMGTFGDDAPAQAAAQLEALATAIQGTPAEMQQRWKAAVVPSKVRTCQGSLLFDKV